MSEGLTQVQGQRVCPKCHAGTLRVACSSAACDYDKIAVLPPVNSERDLLARELGYQVAHWYVQQMGESDGSDLPSWYVVLNQAQELARQLHRSTEKAR